MIDFQKYPHLLRPLTKEQQAAKRLAWAWWAWPSAVNKKTSLGLHEVGRAGVITARKNKAQ